MLAGPALAGLVAGGWGLRGCYVIDTVSFGASLYALFRLPVMRAPGASGQRPSIASGLHYIRKHRLLLAAFLTDLDVVMLGLPVALFPALNAEHFGGHPQTLGLLSTAIGVGGILTAVLSGPTGRYVRQGRGMLAGAVIWGAAMAGFGLARNLPLALAMLAVAGAVDTLTVTFRSAMVQAVTPDEFRGRVSSVEFIIGAGGPIGSVESGTVAALSSPVVSAVSGGVACVAVAVGIALAFPAFRRYSARPEGIPEPTAAAAPAS
jgi:MFS family permease